MLESLRIRSAAAVIAVLVGSLADHVAPPASADVAGGENPCIAGTADIMGWSTEVRSDEFESPVSLAGWKLYRGIGHKGNGLRTAEAITVADGILTITGDPAGNTGGMAWLPGQLYGRWEVCSQTPPGSAGYHPVVLLWPDSELWPEDGELDFMEILDPTRQNVTATIMHAFPEDPADPNERFSIAKDATEWHSWAIEWTPDHITGFVDGDPWYTTTRHVPHVPMHLCLQLDNFGGDLSQAGQLNVAWVRQYAL